MSARGERTLMQHLTDRDALDVLAREGVPDVVLPTQALRPVYRFALDYFFANGRMKAPSVAAIRAEDRWANVLDDAEIDLEVEPEDSIEWAIEDLKGTFVHKEVMALNKAFATDMADADIGDRVAVLAEYATKFVSLSVDLESNAQVADIRESMSSRLFAYDERSADRGQVYGLRFGLPKLDEYTRGIHPGELAVAAAPPKAGKSYLLDWVALREWQAGHNVVLFTLENSPEMTQDRMACLACGVDARRWQHGNCTDDEVGRVREWVEKHVTCSDRPLWILQPPPGERSVPHMVRTAQVLGADALLIDQLTFVELEGEARQPRHERIGQTLHLLKAMISTGRDRVPCLLAHQINREGVKAVRKTGHLLMEHLAESAEVERTADWVFGLYQSGEHRATQRALFQTLASRRDDTKHFEMMWNVNTGMVSVLRETKISEND